MVTSDTGRDISKDLIALPIKEEYSRSTSDCLPSIPTNLPESNLTLKYGIPIFLLKLELSALILQVLNIGLQLSPLEQFSLYCRVF